MNQKALPQITQAFVRFGKLFQLPEPPADYIQAIQEELSDSKWTIQRIQDALEYLKGDTQYNESARYNKYPTICDIYRADFELNKI